MIYNINCSIKNNMTKHYLSLFILILLLTNKTTAQEIKRDSLFDSDWKFYKGKISGAEKPDYDDKTWRTLDLPHDWSIEDLPLPDKSKPANGKPHIISGPFDSEAIGSYNTGYTIGGTGWYRKHFKLPNSMAGKITTINFDGVYMNADVWVNGHHLGNHPYGYTAFWFNLSKYLNYGDSGNVIAVEVKNEGVNSRWYSGSGIYRHVYLNITDKIHVAPWGSFVTTTVADSLNASVDIKTTINNYTLENADITVIYSIFNAKSEKVGEKKFLTQLYRNLPSTIDLSFDVSKPDLWSPESPTIYTAVCEIVKDGVVIDKADTKFGIRTLRFDSEKGFFLNGKHVKLAGGAMHANNGPLGAVCNDRAEERRIELMKAAGFNAIRCGHNPPSAVFLHACDKLGMLVLVEAFDVWTKGWRDDDYHVYFNDWWRADINNMIMRDRNHPSVFAWGIGNQIRENRDSIGVVLAYQMAALVRTLDPSRPVAADVAQTGKNWRNCPPDEWKKCDPIFAALDICGYSYQSSQYENDHQRLPNRKMFSIEIDPRHSFDNWMRAMDYDYVLGNFEWTAMDFMGEVSLGWWGYSRDKSQLYPWTSSYCGDIDLCGFRRPRSYYRDILFKRGSKLSVFVYTPVHSFEGNGDSPWGWDDVKPSWTWPGYENKVLPVEVYSACDSVELLLNGKSLGTKVTSRATQFKAQWQVAYVTGKLRAVGFIKGKEAAKSELVTAGKPYKIKLIADRQTIKANNQDLSYITVEVLDKTGVLVPNVENLIKFSIKGEGKQAAVGNGNPKSVESFQQPYRKAYEGKCLLIIKATNKEGKIEINAASGGLVADKIELMTIH
jgi:beta-galactosidase